AAPRAVAAPDREPGALLSGLRRFLGPRGERGLAAAAAGSAACRARAAAPPGWLGACRRGARQQPEPGLVRLLHAPHRRDARGRGRARGEPARTVRAPDR